MKKPMSFILALSLMICMVPAVSAASNEATEAAEALYEMELFRGTGTNSDGTPIFDLDKTPTRNQAVIMLVRLLCKEDEALTGNWELPFTDVAKDSTAYPYIGYAYANGLTSGTTATTYSGGSPIRANQYITFVLRSLGYESGVDFTVSEACAFSDSIGLTQGQYTATSPFTRGDVAIISYNSLSCAKKGADLFENIPEETPEQAKRHQQFRSRYQFPITSKGLTLTWDQTRALVGQDLSVVKEYVKSLEDVLYYMVASGYTRGDLDIELKDPNLGWSWHFNTAPGLTLQRNVGNCGGTAGFVASLLEGDYEEVGLVNLYELKGGHVTNYLLDGDTYLALDVNKFAGGAASGYDRSLDLARNAELNTAVKRAIGNKYDLIFTYTGCFDGDIPSSGPKPEIYIAEGYAQKVNVVKEGGDGLVLRLIPANPEVLETIQVIRNHPRYENLVVRWDQ